MVLTKEDGNNFYFLFFEIVHPKAYETVFKRQGKQDTNTTEYRHKDRRQQQPAKTTEQRRT